MVFLLSVIFGGMLGCTSEPTQIDTAYFAGYQMDALSEGEWLMGTGFLFNNQFLGHIGRMVMTDGEPKCRQLWIVERTDEILDCSVCEPFGFLLTSGTQILEQGECDQSFGEGLVIGVGHSAGMLYALNESIWEMESQAQSNFETHFSSWNFAYQVQ